MESDLGKLRRLRGKRSDLYLESLNIGIEIRELEVHVRELKPKDRVERDLRDNWSLTLGILKKVGIISTTDWADIPRDAMASIYALHHVRRDVREAIAQKLGITIPRYIRTGGEWIVDRNESGKGGRR